VLEDGDVIDECRTRYIQTHLNALAAAIEQGVNIAGYFYWSLLDNFEWAEGYSKRFGIVHVDFASQQRTMKASGRAYRDFLRLRAHSLPTGTVRATEGRDGSRSG